MSSSVGSIPTWNSVTFWMSQNEAFNLGLNGAMATGLGYPVTVSDSGGRADKAKIKPPDTNANGAPNSEIIAQGMMLASGVSRFCNDYFTLQSDHDTLVEQVESLEARIAALEEEISGDG